MCTSVLAVDLGKTSCRAVLYVGTEHFRAEGAGARGLAVPEGLVQAHAAIQDVAEPLLRAAGLQRVDAVGVGAAGALTAPVAARTLAEHLCVSLPADRVAVCSDATTSHAGALAGKPGVVLAIGTGAVAMAVAPSGASQRVDGWGPWLGDEGGGAWLGLQGLRAALRSWDGRGPDTILEDAAKERFGRLEALAGLLEGCANPPCLAATFAADVAEAARNGDHVSAALLAKSVAALVDAVRAALTDLPHSSPVRFAVVGGMTELGPILTEPLFAALAHIVPVLLRVGAAGTALEGARLLALNVTTVHEPLVCRAVSAGAPRRATDLPTTAAVRPEPGDFSLRSTKI